MSIKIGDRVLLRGFEGNIRDIQFSMGSEWLDVTLERTNDIGKYEEITFNCVSLEEITPLKKHETTEKQQYTGEWGGKQQ